MKPEPSDLRDRVERMMFGAGFGYGIAKVKSQTKKLGPYAKLGYVAAGIIGSLWFGESRQEYNARMEKRMVRRLERVAERELESYMSRNL